MRKIILCVFLFFAIFISVGICFSADEKEIVPLEVRNAKTGESVKCRVRYVYKPLGVIESGKLMNPELAQRRALELKNDPDVTNVEIVCGK